MCVNMLCCVLRAKCESFSSTSLLLGETLSERERDHVWARAVARHTVMIGNLPPELRRAQDLKHFIETYMYRNSILTGLRERKSRFVSLALEGVVINFSMTKLLSLYEKQQVAKAKFEESEESEHFRPGGEPFSPCILTFSQVVARLQWPGRRIF